MNGQRKIRAIKPIKTHPAKTNFSIGAGITNSAVFLQRNTLDNTKIQGFSGYLMYDLSKTLRLSFDYTRYSTTDIAPTWYNIHASTIEANLHVLWHSKGHLSFYPIAGLSLNIFKGYFTGINDYQNLTAIYSTNNEITTRWVGLNTGVGMEYSLKPVILFGSCKMRVGFSEGHSELNIVDVCFSAGIRYNLRVPSLYSLFKGTRNRYFLDAEK
jgi:hypothetical protein